LVMSKKTIQFIDSTLNFNLLSHKQQSGANYCVSG
jgi:hypothetical protein